MNDLERLQRFASGDQDAFTEIVTQHVNAVYSTAWRVLQNSHLAEEVTQDTFSLLAQKAPALRRNVILIAWLHRTSWNFAMKTLRSETRRRDREQQITSTDMTTSTPDPAWKQISPILDEGIEALGEPDRRALLLRFFEEKTSNEISIALGISETAARSRVSRAVERLRLWFKQRGVTLTSTALITLLTTYSLQAAPAALHLTVNSAVRLAAAKSFAPVSLGSKLSILLTQMKLKTALIGGLALLFALLVANQIRININDKTLTASGQLPALLKDLKEQRKSVFAGLKSRLGNESAAAKAERQALEEIKGILYSKDSDSQLPPMGMREAILASGSRKREALDMLREAIHSGDRRASYRAATSLQFFREFADELVPEILAVMKTSTDGYLINSMGYAGFSLNHQDTRRPFVIDAHDTQILPTVIDAFKANPAAGEGMRSWFGSYFRLNKSDQSAGLNLLSPLLDSPDSQQRLTAALILSQTGGKDDPRLTSALLSGLNVKRYPEGGSLSRAEAEEITASYEKAGSILLALKSIGAPARSAGETIAELVRDDPGLRDMAYDTLARIAPDLRSQIPELDAKLKKLEAAAELENKMQSGKGSASDLLLALQNPEARMKAVESLGALSDRASEVLPRLREILNTGDSDERSDAANYLDAVSRSIRKLDPSSPEYVSSHNLGQPLMEVSSALEKNEDKGSKALGDKLMYRRDSPRPYTLEEVISIVEKIKEVDPGLANSFVKKLGNTELTEMQNLSAQLKDRGYGVK